MTAPPPPPLPPAVYAAAAKPAPDHDAYAITWRLAPVHRVLRSIVQATRVYGWPHPPTPDELTEIPWALMDVYLPTTGSYLCRFQADTVGRGYCGFVARVDGVVLDRFRVNWRTFEDGSIRMGRARTHHPKKGAR